MSTKKVTDEAIITALLSAGTIKDAAKLAGISERALYDRMKTGDFQALYKSAKADLIRAAMVNLNNHLQEAINTAAEIMTDKDINPATRLQAAQTILNNAGKFAQHLQTDENGVTAQQESNTWSII